MDVWHFHLHWGWNPVVFFVFLVAAFALAVMAKKQVLWLVPALVMYVGLDWALPWSWLFKLVFWIGVAIVLVTALRPGRTEATKFPLKWVSALIAVILILGGINWLGDLVDGNGKKSDATPTTTVTTEPSPTETVTPTPKGLDEKKVGKAFAREMHRLGFQPGEVSVGTVDWSKNPVDHRGGAVGTRVESPEELTSFLASDSKEGSAARRHNLKAVPVAERERVLDGSNYIPVQYKVGIQYGGNTYWEGDKLMRGGKVVAKAGDVFWVYMTKNYKIVWDAAVRADCSNPGLVRPPRPHRPPSTTPPTPNPKCPPSMPYGSPPFCKDGPEHDPAAQGNAPTGGGHNDTDGPGVYQPTQPTFPSSPHTNPPTPSPTGVPQGSTPAPTSGSTPSPEPGSNPTDGGGNSGDPGTGGF